LLRDAAGLANNGGATELSWKGFPTCTALLGDAVNRLCQAAFCVGALVLAAHTVAAEPFLPRQQHCWAHFPCGTWKKVTVVTQTMDANGRTTGTSTSETTTTLVGVDDAGVTLRVDTIVEVGGKRVQTPSQTIRQTYTGQPAAVTTDAKTLGDEKLVVDGKDVPCQIWQMKGDTPDGQRQVKLYYAANQAPYLLKRETVTNDKMTSKPITTTKSDIIALDMPYRINGELHTVAFERTTASSPSGSSSTLAVISTDIPGGVVTHTTKELDTAGRLVCRSTLETIDYHVSGDDNDPAQQRFRNLRRERRMNRQ